MRVREPTRDARDAKQTACLAELPPAHVCQAIHEQRCLPGKRRREIKYVEAVSELDEEDRDEMDHSGAEGDGYGIAAAKIVAVQAPESARTAGRKPRASIGKSSDDRRLRQGGIVARHISSPSPPGETPFRLNG